MPVLWGRPHSPQASTVGGKTRCNDLHVTSKSILGMLCDGNRHSPQLPVVNPEKVGAAQRERELQVLTRSPEEQMFSGPVSKENRAQELARPSSANEETWLFLSSLSKCLARWWQWHFQIKTATLSGLSYLAVSTQS